MAAGVAEFLGLIDWGAVSFVALVAVLWMHLWRMDQDTDVTFKLVQFVSGPDGQANSASLAYVGIFLVGTWLLFYREIQGRDTDLLYGAMLAGFVTGSIWRKNIDAKERIATGEQQEQQG